MPFEPCTLKMGKDGDAGEFFAKVTGYGYNDMISLPTLTKDSILDNLKRRFKVPRPRARADRPRGAAGRPLIYLPPAARPPASRSCADGDGVHICRRYCRVSQPIQEHGLRGQVDPRQVQGRAAHAPAAPYLRPRGPDVRRCRRRPSAVRTWGVQIRKAVFTRVPRRLQVQYDGARLELAVDPHLGRVGCRQDRGDEGLPHIYLPGVLSLTLPETCE